MYDHDEMPTIAVQRGTPVLHRQMGRGVVAYTRGPGEIDYDANDFVNPRHGAGVFFDDVDEIGPFEVALDELTVDALEPAGMAQAMHVLRSVDPARFRRLEDREGIVGRFWHGQTTSTDRAAVADGLRHLSTAQRLG